MGTSPDDFFGAVVQTKGHLPSLDALRAGHIDVASIDSNVLCSQRENMSHLRVLDSVGPWPSQPVVVRQSMDDNEQDLLRQALAQCGPWPEFGFTRFGVQVEGDLEQVPTAGDGTRKGC